jgi:C7-cyclitol 7-kinase
VTRSGRHLVYDVGGTQLRAAVYEGGSGAIGDVSRVDAPSHVRHPDAPWSGLRDQLVAAMSALRSRLDPEHGISSAVVAFPGPVDREGRVLGAPPLWGPLATYPFPYPLARDLRRAWPGVDVRVVNDVTAAGYRYLRDADDELCVVTISTGIGNKVFARGRPLLGPSGQGGEIGHLQVDPSPTAPPCDCGGGRGHLAAIASGRGMQASARRRAERDEPAFRASAIARAAQLTPSTVTAEALADAYRGGDAWAGALIREGSDALGAVLAAIHMAVGVERFVLIGGFSFGLGARFCDDVQAALAARCWSGASSGALATAVVRVELGDDDGRCALIGGGRAIHLGLLTGS